MKTCDYCDGVISLGDAVSSHDLLGVLHYSKISCAEVLRSRLETMTAEAKHQGELAVYWKQEHESIVRLASIEAMKAQAKECLELRDEIEDLEKERDVALLQNGELIEALKQVDEILVPLLAYQDARDRQVHLVTFSSVHSPREIIALALKRCTEKRYCEHQVIRKEAVPPEGGFSPCPICGNAIRQET